MKAPIPKEQEDMVHDYIIRIYLIDILENDLKVIEKANFKLNEPYINLVESILRKIRIELRDKKVEMKKLKIKVADPTRDNEDFVQYDYFVRGYHAFMRYWEPAINMHATKLLEKYFIRSRQ